MAMTPTVFTISGLSTELGRDRRTIADALRHYPSDGKVGSHDGWYLTTALMALEAKRSSVDRPTARSFLVEVMLDRLGMKRTKKSHMEVTLDQFAKVLGQDSETVLVWIRVGMPYASAGNWSTGEGFSIRTPHALEWLGLVGAHVEQCNDKAAFRALRLDRI